MGEETYFHPKRGLFLLLTGMCYLWLPHPLLGSAGSVQAARALPLSVPSERGVWPCLEPFCLFRAPCASQPGPGRPLLRADPRAGRRPSRGRARGPGGSPLGPALPRRGLASVPGPERPAALGPQMERSAAAAKRVCKAM